MGFGENVRRLLEEKNSSQNELARMINMSSSGISTALSPNGNPRLDTVYAIARALNCPASLLLEEEHETTKRAYTHDEEMLLSVFQQLTAEGQRLLLKNAMDYLDTPSLRKNASISSMG